MTRIPPIITPRKIRLRAFQYSTPNKNATKAPVPAPLPGKGIPTSAIRNIVPYRLNFFECSFLVLLKRFSKNLSMYADFFLKNSDIGPIIASMIAPGMNVPAVANRNVLVVDKPSSIPTGMANLSSRKGVIAVKKTINSGIIMI